MNYAIPATLKNLMDAARPETLARAMRSLQADFGLSPGIGESAGGEEIHGWISRGFTKSHAVILAEIELQAGTPFLRRAAVARYAELLRLQVAIAQPRFTVVPLPAPPPPAPRKTARKATSLPPFIGIAYGASGIVTRRTILSYTTAKVARAVADDEGFDAIFDRHGEPVEFIARRQVA